LSRSRSFRDDGIVGEIGGVGGKTQRRRIDQSAVTAGSTATVTLYCADSPSFRDSFQAGL
jgi:hypothetical protein